MNLFHRIHTGMSLYECDICKKSYRGKSGIRIHMQRHNTMTASEDAYCAECDIQFKCIQNYKSHLKENSKHRMSDILK